MTRIYRPHKKMNVEAVAKLYDEAAGVEGVLAAVKKHGSYVYLHKSEINDLEKQLKELDKRYDETFFADLDDEVDGVPLVEYICSLQRRLETKRAMWKLFHEEYETKYLERHVMEILRPRAQEEGCPELIKRCYENQRARLDTLRREKLEAYVSRIQMVKERIVFYENRVSLSRAQLAELECAAREMEGKLNAV